MFICQPIDMVRVRLTIDNKNSIGKRQFSGSFDCLKKIYKAEGLKGVFGGATVSCIGIFPYRAFYFGFYDTAKERILKGRDNFFLKWLLAQSFTIMAGLCFYPLDTVRRRIMIEAGKPKELKIYKNSFDCIYKMIKEEGYFGMYKGYATNAIRTVGSSVVLVLYDEMQKYLKKMIEKKKQNYAAVKNMIKDIGFSEEQERDFHIALQGYFREWLSNTGNYKEMDDIVRMIDTSLSKINEDNSNEESGL